jgi:hypothetical protein
VLTQNEDRRPPHGASCLDHDGRKHYPNGTDLVDDFEDTARCIPEDAIPRLHAITQPLMVRERCRLRRLTVVSNA